MHQFIKKIILLTLLHTHFIPLCSIKNSIETKTKETMSWSKVISTAAIAGLITFNGILFTKLTISRSQSRELENEINNWRTIKSNTEWYIQRSKKEINDLEKSIRAKQTRMRTSQQQQETQQRRALQQAEAEQRHVLQQAAREPALQEARARLALIFIELLHNLESDQPINIQIDTRDRDPLETEEECQICQERAPQARTSLCGQRNHDTCYTCSNTLAGSNNQKCPYCRQVNQEELTRIINEARRNQSSN